jgi:hypothetical protein
MHVFSLVGDPPPAEHVSHTFEFPITDKRRRRKRRPWLKN